MNIMQDIQQQIAYSEQPDPRIKPKSEAQEQYYERRRGRKKEPYVGIRHKGGSVMAVRYVRSAQGTRDMIEHGTFNDPFDAEACYIANLHETGLASFRKALRRLKSMCFLRKSHPPRLATHSES